MKISILQPFIPHYRKAFIERLQALFFVETYCYNSAIKLKKNFFQSSDVKTKRNWSFEFKGVLIYDFLPFLSSDIVILMLNVSHLSTWILLLLSKLFGYKVILWGHGISVKRYFNEEKKLSRLIRWQISLADDIWFYTNKEKKIWENEFKNKRSFTSLNNTISGIEDILNLNYSSIEIQNLRSKYKINADKVFIFCARFTIKERRADLLYSIIQGIPSNYAVIIIGDGQFKPDFSSFDNVYDFGSTYDKTLKEELFAISDIYLQPAWLGLSIVEAMAYGLPVFTLKRSETIKQCVEYEYLIESHGGLVFSDIKEMVMVINKLGNINLDELGKNAKDYARYNLRMSDMVQNAKCSISKIS
tara:strand:+ start:3894 stop:4970 length:1077 start_codon:yes stop_codon:yes gene_type:complete